MDPVAHFISLVETYEYLCLEDVGDQVPCSCVHGA